jgi:hypothetical protein
MTQHNNFEPGDACPRILDPVQQAAVEELTRELAKRYSEEAVAARLRVLEAEAEALRKMRRVE